MESIYSYYSITEDNNLLAVKHENENINSNNYKSNKFKKGFSDCIFVFSTAYLALPILSKSAHCIAVIA